MTVDPPPPETTDPFTAPTEPGTQTGGPEGEPTESESVPDGQPIGNYEVLEELARGGMGVVYRARQTGLDRIVALKKIRPGAGPGDLRRFRTEAEAAGSLQHPHIVSVHEIGEHEGELYLTMDFVEGGHLADRIPSLAEQPRDAVALLIPVARAVDHAHQHGILHRDLKPANILLDADGRPLVTDFGLAKRVEAPDVTQTATGVIMGTPAYMSPEQAAGDSSRHTVASDLFSLGVILYELLVGRRPFEGSSVVSILRKVAGEEPPPPRRLRPTLDRDLETICLKCLDKEPQRRYRSAGELADDLERWLAGRPIQARPLGAGERIQKWARRRPAVAGLLLALTVSVAVGLVGILTQWRRAEQNAHDAQKQARDLTIRAKHMARSVYQNRMRRLHDSLRKNNDFFQLRDRIEKYERTKDPLAPTPGFEWHLLKRLVAPKNRTFDLFGEAKGGSRPPLRRIALDPQGTTLAVAADGRVVLWSLAEGEQLTDHALPSWEKGERVCQIAWTRDPGGLTVTSFRPPREGAILRLEPNGLTGSHHLQPERLWQALRVRRLPADGSRFGPPEPFDPGLFAGDLHLHNLKELRSLHDSLGPRRNPWLPFLPSFLFTIPSRSEWVVGGAILQEPDLPGLQKSARRTQGSLFLWNPDTGKVRVIHKERSEFFHHGAIDPTGNRIATLDLDSIRMHSLSNLEVEYRVSLVDQGESHRIAFTPDGTHLAICFENGLVTLSETEKGGKTDRFIDPSGPGSDLLFLPEKKELLTAHEDGMLRIWNTENRRETRILASRSSDSIAEFGFDPRTNRIVRILQSGSLSSRSLTPRAAWEPYEFSSASSRLEIPCGVSSAGRYAYGNLADRGLQVIDLPSGKTHPWEDPEFRAQTVRFPDSGGGFGILAYHTAGDRSRTRIVWKPFGSETPRSLGTWPELLSDRLFLKKMGGSSFVLGVQEKTGLHWNVLELDPDRTEAPPILAHGSGILIQMALSSDGERVATVTCDESGARWRLQVRELGRGTTIWERDLGRVPCTELLYHRAADRDRLFLVRLGDQEENIPSSVQILDGRDGEELMRLHASVEWIGQIHLDPSGRHLLAHTWKIDLPTQHSPGSVKIRDQIELWDGRPLSQEE